MCKVDHQVLSYVKILSETHGGWVTHLYVHFHLCELVQVSLYVSSKQKYIQKLYNVVIIDITALDSHMVFTW